MAPGAGPLEAPPRERREQAATLARRALGALGGVQGARAVPASRPPKGGKEPVAALAEVAAPVATGRLPAPEGGGGQAAVVACVVWGRQKQVHGQIQPMQRRGGGGGAAGEAGVAVRGAEGAGDGAAPAGEGALGEAPFTWALTADARLRVELVHARAAALQPPLAVLQEEQRPAGDVLVVVAPLNAQQLADCRGDVGACVALLRGWVVGGEG